MQQEHLRKVTLTSVFDIDTYFDSPIRSGLFYLSSHLVWHSSSAGSKNVRALQDNCVDRNNSCEALSLEGNQFIHCADTEYPVRTAMRPSFLTMRYRRPVRLTDKTTPAHAPTASPRRKPVTPPRAASMAPASSPQMLPFVIA